MPPSKTNLEQERLLGQCLRELQLTVDQVEKVLDDVRKIELNGSATQLELQIIAANVREVIPAVRTMGTELAVFKSEFKALLEDVKELKDNNRQSSLSGTKNNGDHLVKIEEAKGKWQTIGLIVGGVFSGLSSIAALILSIYK